MFSTKKTRTIGTFGIALGSVALVAGCSSSETAADSDNTAARMAFVNAFAADGPVAEFTAGLTCYAEKNDLPDPIVVSAEGDINKQLTDMDGIVARSGEVDGMFVIPLDPAALRPPYQRARDAGIEVIDPMVADPDGNYPTEASSHVAPDDLGVGQMIVDYLTSEHPDVQTVVYLSPPPGGLNDARSEAFRNALDAAGLELVQELHLDALTTEEAQRQMEDFLISNPDIDAVFAQNGATGRGVALAAESQGADPVITSLDADPETLGAVERGMIDATFGADLFSVAYQASEQVEALKAGEEVSPVLVPYQVFTADTEVPATPDERCESYGG